jgi:hypothetical protein
MKHDLPTYLYDTEEHNALRDAGTETSSSVPNIWQNWLTDRAAINSCCRPGHESDGGA